MHAERKCCSSRNDGHAIWRVLPKLMVLMLVILSLAACEPRSSHA